MGSTGSSPAAEQPTAPPDAPSTDEFEVVDGASAASESGAENSSSIHAEGPLIRGLGHAAASLKVGTVAAIVALLTVPDEYQPMLRLALQAALGLVMLWVWRFVLPALRAATEVGGPRGAEEGGGKGSNPNGELTLADALPGRIDTPGMLPLNKWGEPDGRCAAAHPLSIRALRHRPFAMLTRPLHRRAVAVTSCVRVLGAARSICGASST